MTRRGSEQDYPDEDAFSQQRRLTAQEKPEITDSATLEDGYSRAGANGVPFPPRLNPLIHLAMSPTAAPNNTPVEGVEFQPGSRSDDRRMLPPLRQQTPAAAEDSVVGGGVDGANDHVMTQPQQLHSSTRTPPAYEVQEAEAPAAGPLGTAGKASSADSNSLRDATSTSATGPGSGDESKTHDLHAAGSAMTPKRLHFDSSTEKIDPGAGISSISTQKINITSLLNSRSTAESISPPPPTADDEYTMHFPSSAASKSQSQGSTSFLQPKYPQHRLQNDTTVNRVISPNFLFENDEQNAMFQNGSSSSDGTGNNAANNATSANVMYKPKFFNTKFDELRNRVLLGSSGNKYPQSNGTANPNSSGQDSNVDAEAAAIISQMRSSPLPSFSEQFGNGNNGDSRPNSSVSNNSVHGSHFSKRNFHKPVIKVNNRPFSNQKNDNAIMEDDESDDDYDENDSGSVDTVAWNKNGRRRLSRRKSGPPEYRSQSKDIKQEHNYHNDGSTAEIMDDSCCHVKRSRSSSLSIEPTGLLSPNSKRAKQLKFKESNYNNDLSNEQMVKSSGQIKKRNATGARSRTGCWICRLRKKKCTEEKPQCQNCVRLNLECFYDIVKPDFISDPIKKAAKLEEIKKKTKEAKRQAMKKKTWL